MRIAFLTTTSLESPYGLGRCFPFARQLAALGHDVHIVALHHDWAALQTRQFQTEGVSVHYVGQMQARKYGNTTVYFSPLRLIWVILAGLWGLTAQAIRLRADLYHIGKPHPQNSFAGLIASRWLRRRPVCLDYDDLEAEINRTSNCWQRSILAWLEATIPRWVDGVTVHTQFLEERLIALGVPKVRILRLPSCVDPTRFHAVSESMLADWRKRLAIQDQRVIGYVGTLALGTHPIDLLLHAFARLIKQCDNLILLIVGGGADLVVLQELAEQLQITSQTRFVGRVMPALVPTLFRLLDISVDPVADNDVARARWPLKMIESLASDVPVVTGDVGDRRALLGDNVAGLLVAPDNAAALAEALAEILQNSALHAQLKAGCRRQLQQYDVTQLTLRLLAFYNTL